MSGGSGEAPCASGVVTTPGENFGLRGKTSGNGVFGVRSVHFVFAIAVIDRNMLTYRSNV